MSIDEKAHGTVIKLLQMTLKRELEWNRVTDTRVLTHGTDDVVPVAYTTKLADNYFALYEARFRSMDGDENVYWTDRVVLRLIDDDERPIWDFPSMAATATLLRKVQLQATGVEARLDQILKL